MPDFELMLGFNENPGFDCGLWLKLDRVATSVERRYKRKKIVIPENDNIIR